MRLAMARGMDKVSVRSPNVQGYLGRVDRAKYTAMKEVLLDVLASGALTQNEMLAEVKKRIPGETFPANTYRWWAKTVQLDLEARGVVVREPEKPLRWRRG
jgi:hypothetical protein